MTKAADGEIVEATAVFLPGAFAAMVEGALEQEGVDHMQFAIEVWAKARGTDGAFAYTVKSLIQREVDPFKEIRSKALAAGARILQLPAPSPHAEHVTGPELAAGRPTLEATATDDAAEATDATMRKTLDDAHDAAFGLAAGEDAAEDGAEKIRLGGEDFPIDPPAKRGKKAA